LTEERARFIVKEENTSGSIPVFWSSMGSFGEDLRMERLSRGIALEEITAVTKISQHFLVALEQDRFRLLPGGILSKGIVRGYTGALGLDQHDWTERFMKAYVASGQVMDDDRSWMAFASNVGKARILRHDAVEIRLRWLGAILLLIVVAVAGFITVRYFGVRAGWWPNLLPWPRVAALSHAASTFLHCAVTRVESWLGH
jgi:cytoskeletal protein RodZ